MSAVGAMDALEIIARDRDEWKARCIAAEAAFKSAEHAVRAEQGRADMHVGTLQMILEHPDASPAIVTLIVARR